MSNANTPVLRLDGIRKSFNGNEGMQQAVWYIQPNR